MKDIFQSRVSRPTVTIPRLGSRYEICRGFKNEKYRTFGERLIFAEYPAALPPARRRPSKSGAVTGT